MHGKVGGWNSLARSSSSPEAVPASAGPRRSLSPGAEPSSWWRGEVEGEETVALARQTGGAGRFVRTDVTRPDDLDALHRLIAAEHGRLDIAFDNAGFQEPRAPVAEQDPALYDRVFDTNLRAV